MTTNFFKISTDEHQFREFIAEQTNGKVGVVKAEDHSDPGNRFDVFALEWDITTASSLFPSEFEPTGVNLNQLIAFSSALSKYVKDDDAVILLGGSPKPYIIVRGAGEPYIVEDDERIMGNVFRHIFGTKEVPNHDGTAARLSKWYPKLYVRESDFICRIPPYGLFSLDLPISGFEGDMEPSVSAASIDLKGLSAADPNDIKAHVTLTLNGPTVTPIMDTPLPSGLPETGLQDIDPVLISFRQKDTTGFFAVFEEGRDEEPFESPLFVRLLLLKDDDENFQMDVAHSSVYFDDFWDNRNSHSVVYSKDDSGRYSVSVVYARTFSGLFFAEVMAHLSPGNYTLCGQYAIGKDDGYVTACSVPFSVPA